MLFQYLSLSLGSFPMRCWYEWGWTLWIWWLIVGHQFRERPLRLVWSWHRRCWWSRIFSRVGLADRFLPDDHADQENGQGDSNHGGQWVECPVGLGRFDLVEFFEQLAGIKLSIVFCPQTLNDCLDALGVGSAEEFGYFSGTIHGLLLDLNYFGFICCR